MAIYHHSIKIISRGKGKSAVAAAAYRSGETITNEYDGITHDYTRKGGIVHTEILLPDHAPDEYADRTVLWNAVEKIEKAKNSQLAREIEIALPTELTREKNIELARDYVSHNFVAAGMCADVCIHDKNDGNPHAHIMLTMRPIEPDGSWGTKQRKEYSFDKDSCKIYDSKKKQYKCRTVKTTDWNEQTKAEEWRAAWAQSVNTALAQNSIAERVDHRSYQRQGTDQIPTVHLGVATSQMERKRIRTGRGDINREIEISNKELRQTKARINKLQNWLKAETKPDKLEMPTLSVVISKILKGGEQQTRYGKIRDLKTAASVLSFMQSNRISTIEELRGKVSEFYGRQADLRERLKPLDRRLKTLDEHIKQVESYRKHRKVYEQYQGQKPKHRDAFREAHHAEITLYESADHYLKRHLNGRTSIPLQAWISERGKLSTERSRLNSKYQMLKSEIREVETIRKYAEEVHRAVASPQRTAAKLHDMEV
jgi:ATP-dependent exoDNAse (exonuclease V) alpha subunit